jgi:outer membrane protein assembly factor BamE
MRYSFILLALLCASCGTALPTVKPFKLDVQQGNVVTSKMLLQLRPGMTKSQVRFIMGTPLIQDSFHDKRWDYVYQLRENGKITDQRRVILDFENELLKTVRGDVAPTGSDKLKAEQDAANTGTRVINPNAKPEEKGLVDKLKFWEKDEASAKEAETAKAKAATDTTEKAATTVLPDANSVGKDNAMPVEETKSMLAVPLDVLPASDAPMVTPEPATLPAPAAVESVIVAPPVVEKESTVSAKPLPETAPVEVQPIQAPSTQELPAQMPPTPPAYDSPSGMIFDRGLKLDPEEVDAKPNAATQSVTPRAGNKAAPKPKDLPAEESTGFFDKMLEKIGF